MTSSCCPTSITSGSTEDSSLDSLGRLPSNEENDSAGSPPPCPMKRLVPATMEEGENFVAGYSADEEGQDFLPKLAHQKRLRLPKSIRVYKKFGKKHRKEKGRSRECRRWIQRIYSDTPFQEPVEQQYNSTCCAKKAGRSPLHLLKSYKADFLVDLCKIQHHSEIDDVDIQAEEYSKLFQVMSDLMDEYHQVQAQYRTYSPPIPKET